MCTIIFAYKTFDDSKIVVAENRDEFYERNFLDPNKKNLNNSFKEINWYKAPIDKKEGGTWIGYNSNGLFVTVSNLRSEYDIDKDFRSRGNLVKDVLSEKNVETARKLIETSVEKHNYNSFNISFI